MLDLGTHLDAERRSQFRRLVALSALGHLAVFLALSFSPSFQSRSALPGVVSVDLVAAVPAAAPARAAAARPKPPAPRAVPKPVPPKPKQVVLPKQAAKVPEKVVQETKPKPSPTQEKPQEEDYEELMRKLREAEGEAAPTPVETASAAVAPAAALGGGGSGNVQVSPEVAAWLKQAEIHVRKLWVLAPGFRSEPLETHVLVELDAGGNVLGQPRVRQRSGNPWYDDSVVRAIQKASPLPAPPEAGEWLFVFRPEDV